MAWLYVESRFAPGVRVPFPPLPPHLRNPLPYHLAIGIPVYRPVGPVASKLNSIRHKFRPVVSLHQPCTEDIPLPFGIRPPPLPIRLVLPPITPFPALEDEAVRFRMQV